MQRRLHFPGLLAKDFPQAHPCKLASNASRTATLRTTESESSQDSATSPTSPARAPSMLRCRPKRLNKKPIARPTTKDPSSQDTSRRCTVRVQRHTKHSTQASCTATLTPKRAVLAKTCTPIPALGHRRVRTELLKRLWCLEERCHLADRCEDLRRQLSKHIAWNAERWRNERFQHVLTIPILAQRFESGLNCGGLCLGLGWHRWI